MPLYNNLTITNVPGQWYDAYVPEPYQNPAPLILVLHGGGGCPSDVITKSMMNATADKVHEHFNSMEK